MRINTYEFSDHWNLREWWRNEQAQVQPTEIEISDNLHGYMGWLSAEYGDGTFDGDMSFYDYSSWHHARKHGDTLQTYRITPIKRSPMELGVMSLSTGLLLVAKRPFVVISKFTHWFDDPRRIYSNRYTSQPLPSLQTKIAEMTR
jgi:hypothetical protein